MGDLGAMGDLFKKFRDSDRGGGFCVTCNILRSILSHITITKIMYHTKVTVECSYS